MANLSEQKLLSVKETAKMLGISERTLWSVTMPRGRLVCCKIDKCTLYGHHALDRYIREQEKTNNDE